MIILAERLCIVPKTLKEGEWQCGDKVEALFSDRTPSNKANRKYFRPSRSLCDCQQIQTLSYRAHSKESAIITAGCIRSYRERVLYCRITHLDSITREFKKKATPYCFFRMQWLLLGRSRSGVGVGVLSRYFYAGVGVGAGVA